MGDRSERRFEGEALRERAGDLVERAELLRGSALCVERALAILPETLRLLVQLRVLDRDRELGGERAQQRGLVLRQHAPVPGEDGEEADRVVPHEQRHRRCGIDPRLRSSVADGSEARVRANVLDDQHPAPTERPERKLQQSFRKARVRPGEPDARGRVQLLVLAKVDGEPIDLQ